LLWHIVSLELFVTYSL